jgi:hypothetical protein
VTPLHWIDKTPHRPQHRSAFPPRGRLASYAIGAGLPLLGLMHGLATNSYALMLALGIALLVVAALLLAAAERGRRRPGGRMPAAGALPVWSPACPPSPGVPLPLPPAAFSVLQFPLEIPPPLPVPRCEPAAQRRSPYAPPQPDLRPRFAGAVRRSPLPREATTRALTRPLLDDALDQAETTRYQRPSATAWAGH